MPCICTCALCSSALRLQQAALEYRTRLMLRNTLAHVQDMRMPMTPMARRQADALTFSTPSANLYEENDHSLWSSSFTSDLGAPEVRPLPCASAGFQPMSTGSCSFSVDSMKLCC